MYNLTIIFSPEKSPVFTKFPRVIGTWDFLPGSRIIRRLEKKPYPKPFDTPESKISIWGIEKFLDIPEAVGLSVGLVEDSNRWLIPSIHAESIRKPINIWLFNPDYPLTEPGYVPEHLVTPNKDKFLLSQTDFKSCKEPTSARGGRFFAYDKNAHQFTSLRHYRYGQNLVPEFPEPAVIFGKFMPNKQEFVNGMKVVLTEGKSEQVYPTNRKSLFTVAKTFDNDASMDILTAPRPASIYYEL